MKKIHVFLFVILLSFAFAVVCFAKVDVTIPSFSVKINEEYIHSEYREYPLIVYNDITYFPMTYYDCRHLGLVTYWDNSTRTLSIEQADITCAYRGYQTHKLNSNSDKADICTFNIVVNGKTVDNANETYPLLVYRDVTYFPLTWRFAVDEFDWKYMFDNSYGLVIEANNRKTHVLSFPHIGGSYSVARDENYIYYTGDNNDIRRVPVTDYSKSEVIHTLPQNSYNSITLVDFFSVNESVVMRYHVGGASTGTTYRLKINADGSCTPTTDGNYSQSFIGGNGIYRDGNNVDVAVYNSGRVGTSAVYYSTSDVKDEEIALDSIVFGECRSADIDINNDGLQLGADVNGKTWFNYPQIVGDNVYLTGYKVDTSENSHLYKFDFKTGEIIKILDDVSTFYAISGWNTSLSGMTDMIFYDRGGNRYRYSLATGESVLMDENVKPVTLSSGSNLLVFVGDDGKSSEVCFYDSYGFGSLKRKIFESDNAVDYVNLNGYITAVDYDSNDIRFYVFDANYNFFTSSDMPKSMFIYDNMLYYTTDDNLVVMTELKAMF